MYKLTTVFLLSLCSLIFACMPVTSRQEVEAKAGKAHNPSNIQLYFSESEVPFAFEVVAEGQYWRLSILASKAAAGKLAIKTAHKLNRRGKQIEAVLLGDLYNVKFLRKTGELSQGQPPSRPYMEEQEPSPSPGRALPTVDLSGAKRLGAGLGFSSYGRRVEVNTNGDSEHIWLGTRSPMVAFQFAWAPAAMPDLEVVSGLRFMLPAKPRIDGEQAFPEDFRLSRLQLEVLGRYFIPLPPVSEVRLYPLLGLQGGLVFNEIGYSAYWGGVYLTNALRIGLLAGAGGEYALENGLSVFGELQARFHQNYFNGYGVEVGVRKGI